MLKIIKSFSIIILFIFALYPVIFSQAEMLNRGGVYYGYFNIDRWGQKVFHTGPYHLFVSDEMAKQLESYIGRPLKLDVKEIYQPRNPGGGIIEKITNVTETIPGELVFDINDIPSIVQFGDGIKINLTVRNSTDKEIELGPRSLAYVLVTKTPFSNEAMGYENPDERAFWYYGAAVQSRNGILLQTACRESYIPWIPKEYATNGEGVEVSLQEPTHISPGIYYPLLIKPEGKFKINITVGHELLPGQYEIFFYQPYGNLSYEAKPMSKRFAFDVIRSD